MTSLSYWLDLPHTPRATLTNDSEADVAIVGGGITGVAAAYYCAKNGMRVVLVEKGLIAGGSAGKNAGMVVEGLPIDFAKARERYGNDVAASLWRTTQEAREEVLSLIDRESIDCDLERTGSLYVGLDESDNDLLQQEARERASSGLSSEIIPTGAQLRPSPFTSALFVKDDAMLHPVKFVRGLANAAATYGAQVYEHSPADEIDKHYVKTREGSVRASKVVVAIESSDKNVAREYLTSWAAIVTDPLFPEKREALEWKHGGMLWTTGADYEAVRLIGNRLLICGHAPMELALGQLQEQAQAQMSWLRRYFPTLPPTLGISHSWSGLILNSAQDRPRIRNQDGIYTVSGLGGNGLTNGVLMGKLLAEHFMGAELPALYTS